MVVPPGQRLLHQALIGQETKTVMKERWATDTRWHPLVHCGTSSVLQASLHLLVSPFVQGRIASPGRRASVVINVYSKSSGCFNNYSNFVVC